jgi:threonine/homoserine/homoserine lactone efflux protein
VPGPHTLVVFAAAALMLLVVPGPSVLYVVGRAAERGPLVGLVSVLGVETGALLHVAAAAAGVSALVASSPGALVALRLGGGAYLLWLALRAWRGQSVRPGSNRAVTRARAFRDGLFVDLLNPKTVLFFVAFLPGFVRTGHGAVAVQVASLGLCFVALAVVVDGAYALAAARLMRRMGPQGRRVALASSGIYALLGLLAVAAP